MAHGEAEFVGDGLGFEVDGDLVVGLVGAALEERLDLVVGEAAEDHAVLASVGEEDVGEAGGDDGAEAVLLERPGGVLAGAAAAEVFLGDEDLGALVVWLVEDEVGIRGGMFSVVEGVAPVEEEELAVAGTLDAL